MAIPNWIHLTKVQGTSGITNVTVEADENTTDSGRSYTLTVSAGTEPDDVVRRTVEITQAPVDFKSRYLTFKVTSGGTLTFTHNRTLVSDVGNLTIQYRINKGSWSSLTTSTAGTTVNVSTNDVVEFKGDNVKYGSLPLSYTTLSGSTAQFEAYGNMMSLIDSTNFATKTDITEQYCFNRFFAGSKITTARFLILSTITLPMHCYTSMFQNCTLLTTAPELPNCVMDNSCCNEMYNGCSSLNYIRCYATDISAYRCTYNWVTGVAASGTFVKNASTTWESGNSGIPAGWTIVNK